MLAHLNGVTPGPPVAPARAPVYHVGGGPRVRGLAMLFVTGTKRSGTSMWIEALRAAGFPILGEVAPRGLDAPDGADAARLRDGIYYRTNPHPVTGAYFLPEQVEGYVAQVDVSGVIRSERAYITHLLANVREWREYEASVLRLRAAGPVPEDGSPLPPAYEWWTENFALVRDIGVRRYPARLLTYERILEHPEQVLSEVLAWIGRGDLAAAVPAIRPAYRAATRHGSDSVPPALARVFDDLYAAVAAGKPPSDALLRHLDAAHRALAPELAELQRRARVRDVD